MSSIRTQNISASGKSDSRHGFFDRHNDFKLLILAGLAIASLLWTVKVMSEGSETSLTGRRETMFPVEDTSSTNRDAQSVNVSTHANVETATFALG